MAEQLCASYCSHPASLPLQWALDCTERDPIMRWIEFSIRQFHLGPSTKERNKEEAKEHKNQSKADAAFVISWLHTFIWVNGRRTFQSVSGIDVIVSRALCQSERAALVAACPV